MIEMKMEKQLVIQFINTWKAEALSQPPLRLEPALPDEVEDIKYLQAR